MSQRSFSIAPMPPFRLDFTVWALRRRPENAIDRWDGKTYRRVLMIDSQAVEVAVHQSGGSEEPQLEVDLTGPRLTVQQEGFARGLLERMLGVHKDLNPFYRLARRDPRLQRLVDEFRGLKPPQFPTVFEAVTNGVACQQLSLLVGILLLSRLAHKIGVMLANSRDAAHAFPDPTDFSGVKEQSLRSLGFSANKSQALLEVSSAIRDRRLNLDSLVKFDNQGAFERLVKLKGVGRWTAEYVLLRGLGRLDIFPGDDVGARKKLAQFLRMNKALDYEGVRRAVAGWQPFAGFVYFHLLLARIKKAGWLCSHHAQCAAGYDFTLAQYRQELKKPSSQSNYRQASSNTHEFNELEKNVMKSTKATNAPPTTQPAVFKLTASGTFVERTRQISAAIARRAYELFEARGSENGHDCEDWFRAESELLTPIPATVVDTDGGFKVTAEVPGFTGKDVEVLAEPRRLIIRAKKQEIVEQAKERAALQEKISDEIFRVLELPHEIDPENMTATIKNEVLEVILAKVSPGKEIGVGFRAA